MIEHIMAALSGLQIDNCEIHVDGAEMPGCDGSSQMFVTALVSAGITPQDASRRQLVVTEPTRVGNSENWIEALPLNSANVSIRGHIDYGRDSAIGRQTYDLALTPVSFRQELAPARTFVLQEEAEWLAGQGLCQRVSYQDVLVFDHEGPMNNQLRFFNECVRHKMLDLVGDLALAGCDVVGRFVAHRSGHRLNAELVQTLLSEGRLIESNVHVHC